MADNDKVFMRVVGNVGKKPARSDRREDIIEFSIAQNTGYDDDDEPEWFNIAVFEEGKPHLAEFALTKLNRGSKGVYVEGYGKIKEVNGKVYRDLIASRIALLEFVTKESAPATDDGDDY